MLFIVANMGVCGFLNTHDVFGRCFNNIVKKSQKYHGRKTITHIKITKKMEMFH
jgi:hypothetical protein